MGRTLRRVVASLLSAAVVAAAPAAAHAAVLTDRQRAERAVAYLASKQRDNGSIVAFSPIGSTADAVGAFVAAGVGRVKMRNAIAFLRDRVAADKVDTVGLQAKVVLAVTAAGLDPRTFGGTNLVAAIRGTLAGGHFGTSAVFDDATALLALEAAGVTPTAATATWLAAAQCPDGGWAYDQPYAPGDDRHCNDGSGNDFFTSDTNTTSLVVQALTGLSSTAWVHSPFAFFTKLRDDARGGWGYTAGFGTDANSTALVLQAYAAAARPTPSGGLIALRKLQYPRCGAFAFSYRGGTKGDPDVGATIGAVQGLLREPFPVSGTVASGLPAVPACA